MRIGELAEKAGVTTRTVRYYEEIGLISPVEYSDGGMRLYSQSQLKRLELINQLKSLKFSLKEIKALLACEKLLSESMGSISNYLEIYTNLEKEAAELEPCALCDKKASYQNCSSCNELSGGKIPEILKVFF